MLRHHLLATVFAGGLIAAESGAGTVLYVDADAAPGGDGTSWNAAYAFLQDALAAAPGPGGAYVLVAEGIYLPDRSAAAPAGTGDRHATFQLLDGVTVAGGFAGLGAANPYARDVATCPTVLSGAIGGPAPDDNSYHVVIASGVDETAVLDGVTVTAGFADGFDDPVCFGGPNHQEPCDGDGDCGTGHCISPDSMGAGIYAVGGRPTLVDCTIADNYAAFQGAGILLKAGSHAVMTGCTFSGNHAADNGGAMYLGDSRPTVTGCAFLNNSGGRYAGATCNRDWSDAVFTGCLFEGNTAADTDETAGGGAVVNASSSPTFNGCVFIANQAIAGNGGAVYNKLGFDPDLGPSHPVLESCTFDGNTAGASGGTVYNIASNGATLIDCAMTGGGAHEGGAAYNGAGGVLIMTGCTVSGSVVPLEDPNAYSGRGGAIYNAGTLTLAGSTLAANHAASQGGGVYNQGSGATEITGCALAGNTAGWQGGAVYVPTGSASVVNSVFSDNTALDAAGGIYFRDGQLTMTGCTLAGNSAHTGGGIFLDQAYQAQAPDALITGCLLSGNGAYAGGGLAVVDDGQGTVNVDVIGTRFEGNHAKYGAAVSVQEASGPTFVGCTLIENLANNLGGGVHCIGGGPTLINCLLIANEAAYPGRGGGMYGIDSSLTLINCTLLANQAYWTGGGIHSDQSDLSVTNCIAWSNTDGGGSDESAQIHVEGYGAWNVSYTCIQGLASAGGAGNTSDDPLLNADGRLTAGSPCIDAGSNAALPADSLDLDADDDTGETLPVDIDGEPRLAGDPCVWGAGNTPVDLGADEFQDVDPSYPPGDVDGDCLVGIGDFLMLIGTWGPCTVPCPADLDGSGDVGIVDFLMLLGYWQG